MSTTPTLLSAEHENLLQRVKNSFGAGFFMLLQHFPKLLQFHRSRKSWTLFRFALGCFGAALVILPLSLWNGYITAVFGLFLFVLSILLPPAELESATDRKARELGAQTVVSGGEYLPGTAMSASVQLFISPAHTWALDKNFHAVVVITTREISSMAVVPFAGYCLLRVRWGDHQAEFLYKGVFAQRFARLAEESLRHASGAMPPEPAKHRVAGAN